MKWITTLIIQQQLELYVSTVSREQHILIPLSF